MELSGRPCTPPQYTLLQCTPLHIPGLSAGVRRTVGALVVCSVTALGLSTLAATPGWAADLRGASAGLQGQFLAPTPFESRSVSAPGFSGETLLDAAGNPERSSVLNREEAVMRDRGMSVTEFARKVSYAGVLLLTADRLVRSMDSVMENMQYRCEDGTCLRLDVSPQSRGMEMMLKISRPIGF